MENKSIIKICAIIFGVFIIFAIIEISIKVITQKVNDFSEQKTEEKRQEEIYNSDESIEEREVRDYTKVICQAIEDRDYDYIWQALDEVYRKYKFNDNIEELKTYINNISFGDKYDVTYTNKTGYLYQVTVGITSGESYSSKSFTINVKEVNAKKFMFDEYTNLEEMSETAVYSDLNYEIIYYYNNSVVKTYVLKVKNVSSEDIKLEFLKTTLVYHNGNMIYGNKPEVLELKPSESKNIEIYFSTARTSPSFLELDINKNNENRVDTVIFSEYTL